MNEKKGKNFLDVLVEKGIVNSCGFQRYETLFGAYATYDAGYGQQIVKATSRRDQLEAIMRVMMKAYERWCIERRLYQDSLLVKAEDFSNPDSHRFGCTWIDPRSYVPLNKKQRRIMGVGEFTEDLPIRWVQGRRIRVNAEQKIVAAEKVYVPKDMVYCDYDEDSIYHATSSGTAAGVSREDAIIRALSELIERDAIIRTYLQHECPEVIPEHLLPRDVCAEKRRIEARDWAKKEVHVIVLNGYIPTALVAISNGWYPFVTFGAAASFISFEDAVRKALEEAELNYYDFAGNEEEHMYLPKKAVISPHDHGIYYAGLLNRRSNISWLWSGDELDSIPAIDKTLSDAARDLDLTSIIISERSNETKDIPLWVVRLFSPKLIPISYGNKLIHYEHPSINFDVDLTAIKEPHFFNQGSVKS